MNLIQNHNKDILNLCKAHKVKSLYAFGSVLTERFNKDSDIDFIVSIASDDPIEYAENYLDLKFALEYLFKRKIDLLEKKAIRNKTFENLINQQKTLVYARRTEGVA